MKLYHYIHCPFCLRVRMCLGYLNISYESIVLPYDDEKTLSQMGQKKMLPLLEFKDGSLLNESLDIMAKLDQQNTLSTQEALKDSSLMNLIEQIGKVVHPLAMPYWVYSYEFSESARNYFVNKKEKSKGPFSKLFKRRENLKKEALELINRDIAPYLSNFYQSSQITLPDLLLASHLWGLYMVPEFQFPAKVHLYLQQVKELCRFDYHEDFWK